MRSRGRSSTRGLLAVLLAATATVLGCLAGSSGDEGGRNLGAPTTRVPPVAAPEADVVVEAGDGAPVPRAVSAGVYVCRPTDSREWTDTVLPALLASPPGDVRFCPVGWPAMGAIAAPTVGGTTYESVEREIDAQIETAAPLLDRGWSLSITIASMPRWLSANPGNASRHPNDDWDVAWSRSAPAAEHYGEWEVLVEWLARQYAQRGVHPWYGVWDEPDWMLFASADEYFEMYDRTARALKGADPLAKVGGPAVSNFAAPKNEYLTEPDARGRWQKAGPSAGGDADRRPLLERFVQHVGGSGAPLDFVDFHFPAPSDLGARVTELREMLGAADLSRDLPIRIGEWTYEPRGEVAASEQSSAYVVAMLAAMAGATEAAGNEILHDHTSLFDQSGWADGGWTHVGMVSSDNLLSRPWGLPRPKLHAYKMVGILAGVGGEVVGGGADGPVESLPIRFPRGDTSWHGLATRRADGTVAVLVARLSSSIPSGEISARAGELLVERGVLTEADVDEVLADLAREECRTWISGQGLVARALFEDARAIERVLSQCTDMEAGQRAEVVEATTEAYADVTAELLRPFVGTLAVPFNGAGRVTAWRIDARHANACGYNRRTATSAGSEAGRCGAGGAVDRVVEQADADALRAAGAELAGRGWSQEQIGAVTAALTSCGEGAERPEELTRCTLGELAGRTDLPPTMGDDLPAAYRVAGAALRETEATLVARLVGLPEVGLVPEAEGPAEARDGWAVLDLAVPPDGTVLLVIRPD